MFRKQGVGRLNWVLWCTCLSLFQSTAWAAPRKSPYAKEEAQIPKTPSAPPSLEPRAPSDSFRCERYFKYQGKIISCDSNIRLDGEQLRPIIESVPSAVSELDLYQRNRVAVRTAAYVGTAGLFVMLAGSFISLSYRDSGSPTDTSNSIRNISIIGGGGIVAASFLSGLSLIKTNEEHLSNAVIRYNEAHPEAPIELLFSTRLKF